MCHSLAGQSGEPESRIERARFSPLPPPDVEGLGPRETLAGFVVRTAAAHELRAKRQRQRRTDERARARELSPAA